MHRDRQSEFDESFHPGSVRDLDLTVTESEEGSQEEECETLKQSDSKSHRKRRKISKATVPKTTTCSEKSCC